MTANLNNVALQATILNMTASFITRAEVNAALNTEISARQTGEINVATNLVTLTANLNTETMARINGDTTLTTNLNAEIINRGAAITVETSRALGAESTLTTNIATVTANLNNEIAIRAALATSITTLISNVTTITANLNNVIFTVSSLGASLTTLTTNVATVTANLNNVITTNIALATSVTTLISNVATITANLNAEVTRAMSQDVYLLSIITNVTAGGTSSNSNPEYWMDNNVFSNESISTTVITANTNGYVLKVLGVGFSTYYNPQFQASFLCVFFNPAFGNITTFGVVLYDPVASFLFYHVECPVPIIAMALSVTISLYKSTGQLYPFGGFAGANILMVQYYWTSVAPTSVALGNAITVTGLGFNALTAKRYKCIFTGKNSTNGVITVPYIAPAAANITTLSCGLTPGGFTVVSGTSTVNLTVFEANADNSTGYQVQSTGSAVITFNTCLDQTKDGDETDVDCGGSTCGIICALGKNCFVNSDCLNYCTGGVCIASSVCFSGVFFYLLYIYIYIYIYTSTSTASA